MGDLAYFTSQKQAAAALGVDTDLIKQACIEDPTVSRAGGRIDKEKLAVWLKDYQWKKGPAREPSVSIDEASTVEIKRMRELCALKLQLLNLDKARDNLIPLADVEDALRVTIGAFRQTVNALPGRAAGKIVARAQSALLVMLKKELPAKSFAKVEAAMQSATVDYADVEEILRAEADIVLRDLETCEFFKPEGE